MRPLFAYLTLAGLVLGLQCNSAMENEQTLGMPGSNVDVQQPLQQNL
jgi:hypothetical protein